MGKHTNPPLSESNIKLHLRTDSGHTEAATTTAPAPSQTQNASTTGLSRRNTPAHVRNGTTHNSKDPGTQNRQRKRSEEGGHWPDEESPLSATDAEGKEEEEGAEAEEEDSKEDKADELKESGSHSGLPVDRGWAWVVMLAQFLITFLMVGYGRALSIFILEFLAIFEVPVTAVTIVLGLMTAFFGFGNVLVSHVLMTRFSTRQIMLTGALINSVAIGLTALAPNMVYVTAMHCLIGFSHSLLFVPGITLVSHYFDKRRSFAMAVTNTGLSVSSLVFPPLTEYIVTLYGLRGALLLVAGIELQCLVAVCLLRPVSWYAGRRVAAAQGEPNEDASRLSSQEEEDEKLRAEAPFANRTWNKSKDREEGEKEHAMSRLLAEVKLREQGSSDILVQRSSAALALALTPRYSTSSLSSSLPERTFLFDQPGHYHSSEEMPTLPHHPPPKLKALASAYGRQQSCPSDYPQAPVRFRDRRVADSSSPWLSALSASTVNICGSTMTITTDTVLAMASQEKVKDLCAESGAPKRTGCMSVISGIFDFSLFRNLLFLLIVVYIPLGFSASFVAFYLPSLAVEQGLSRPNAALLMTVAGGVDLVSRLSVGYLADLQLVKRTHLVVVCMTLMGLVCQLSRWFTSFGLLMVFAVVYGLVGGVCNNLFAVVIIDLLGLELLGKVMGLALLVNSAFASVNHIVVGALVDATGSFVIPYNYVGASLFLSSLVLLMEPLARRLENKRQKKLGMDVDSAKEPMEA